MQQNLKSGYLYSIFLEPSSSTFLSPLLFTILFNILGTEGKWLTAYIFQPGALATRHFILCRYKVSA